MDTYEKRFKEAFSRAKKLHETCDSQAVIGWCEYIFPEFCESEDERVRKGLIKAVSATLKGNRLFNTDVTREEALAWLEKQGNPFDDNIITRDDEILQAISIGLTDAKEYLGWSDFGGLPIEEIQNWLEKQ